MDRCRGRRVLVVGHSDADGHVAAEQSRRNVMARGATACRVLVRPELTGSYRFWESGLSRVDFGDAELVIFVDIMLSPHDPTTSVRAIAELARRETHRDFLLIDHHPVDVSCARAPNLELSFTPEVYRCCYGDPGEMMLVAAICDGDEQKVRGRAGAKHYTRAVGLRRAAADRSLAGAPLMGLLAENRWDLMEMLASEPVALHKTVRGRRPSKAPHSEALSYARDAAAQVRTDGSLIQAD